METAHTFYEQGLGLLYDPSVKSGQKKGVGVSWLNIGDQQVDSFFRLCCSPAPTLQDHHNKLDTLLLQIHIDQEEEVSRTPGPVKLLLPKLADLEKQLQKLQTRFAETHFAFDFSSSPDEAKVVDPWGQHFSVTECSDSNASNSEQPGSFEGLVLPCHPGTAGAIAEFYRRIVGVRCCRSFASDLLLSLT